MRKAASVSRDSDTYAKCCLAIRNRNRISPMNHVSYRVLHASRFTLHASNSKLDIPYRHRMQIPASNVRLAYAAILQAGDGALGKSREPIHILYAACRSHIAWAGLSNQHVPFAGAVSDVVGARHAVLCPKTRRNRSLYRAGWILLWDSKGQTRAGHSQS